MNILTTPRTGGAIALLLAAFLLGSGARASSASARLPDRVLTCHVGHATNLDPLKQQDRTEITFDRYGELVLRLPPIPIRDTPPPDATEPADPVDPGTKIMADPTGITSGTLGRFDRVIDLWPERVELTMPMDGGVSKLLIVSDYDSKDGSAQLFVTTAADLATFDLKNTYLGPCSVRIPENRNPA